MLFIYRRFLRAAEHIGFGTLNIEQQSLLGRFPCEIVFEKKLSKKLV